MLLTSLLMLAIVHLAKSGQVKCFCDRDSCDDNLLCQGDFCFIGLRREDNGESPKLRQHCGTAGEIPYLNGGHARCEERIDNWQEICKCEEDFCNTFAYLRSSIDSRQDRRDIVQFTKQDVQYPPLHTRPDDMVYDNDKAYDDLCPKKEVPVGRNQSSSLIVLLVIIPLSVGGFAVCLIFLNYHCKMC